MAAPTITNSYGQSKWGTTTTRLNCELLDTGSTLTEYLTTLARTLQDPGSWSCSGHSVIAYDYIGFWNPDETFSTPRDAGSVTPQNLNQNLVIGLNYKMSFTVDNTYSSVDLVLDVAGNTFTYDPGFSGFVEETFTASSTAKPVFSSAADAVGDGAGTIYCGVTVPISLTNSAETACGVKIYWGTTDGGTDPSAWANVVDFGSVNIANRGTVFYGKKYTDLTGLTAGSTYYYRAFASNAVNGDAWAPSSRLFYTLNSASDAIRCYDIYHLQAMRDDIAKNYVIMRDIDASATTTMNPIYLGASPTYWGFYPAGYRKDDDSQDDPFSGNLDGRGHTITGLWAQDLNDNGGWGGLFGRHSGIAEKFKMLNCTLASAGAGNTGLVAGFSSGTMRYIGIENATINGSGIWVGGLAGQVQTVNDCYVKGGVFTSTSVYLGGIAGQINSSVTRCWSSAELNAFASSGGICGQDYYANMTKCWAVGKSLSSQSGCLTGYMYTSESGNYWYNNASFSTIAYGNYNNAGPNNLTATAFTNTSDLKGNSTHPVFSTWNFNGVWKVVSGDYPTLDFAEFGEINPLYKSSGSFNMRELKYKTGGEFQDKEIYVKDMGWFI